MHQVCSLLSYCLGSSFIGKFTTVRFIEANTSITGHDVVIRVSNDVLATSMGIAAEALQQPIQSVHDVLTITGPTDTLVSVCGVVTEKEVYDPDHVIDNLASDMYVW